MIDFDEIDEWAPILSKSVAHIVPENLKRQLVLASPRYVEDARDFTLGQSSRDAFIQATLRWIESIQVTAYHGTRLTEKDVASVRSIGLLPLSAGARAERLSRALSSHPRWKDVRHRLPETLRSFGPGGAAGLREGQVHLTLSRAGLTDSFNHYLARGSEFDQRVASELLGADGLALLNCDGVATMIQCSVPGRLAILAANPFFPVAMILERGELPNLVSEVIASWSYKQAHPEFQSRDLQVDCGLFFREPVPAKWIMKVDRLTEPIARL